MTFLAPQALLVLLLVPMLLAAYLFMQRRRQRYALRYASIGLVREAVGKGPGVRRHIPPAVFLLAVAAMVLALARPQITRAVAQPTGTVVLSVDVSGSMQATDVTPSRMDAAKAALRQFIAKQPKNVQIGLVSFSDSAALLQAPTRDRSLLLRAVDVLQPVQGTNIGDGLKRALDAVLSAGTPPAAPTASAATATPVASAAGTPTPAPPPGTIVLMSDGESNEGPPPIQIAQQAAASGVRVDTVGLGTAAGTVLHIRGASIRTRLDESTLQGIAQATGGRYFGAQDADQLTQIYQTLAQHALVEGKKIDLTSFAIAGALGLSVAGAALSLLWFNRLP